MFTSRAACGPEGRRLRARRAAVRGPARASTSRSRSARRWPSPPRGRSAPRRATSSSTSRCSGGRRCSARSRSTTSSRSDWVARCAASGRCVAGAVLRGAALRAQPVDEQVVHDPEHPRAHRAALLPHREPAPRALEGVLDQVVGAFAIRRQAPRIAAQARDARDDLRFVRGTHRRISPPTSSAIRSRPERRTAIRGERNATGHDSSFSTETLR